MAAVVWRTPAIGVANLCAPPPLPPHTQGEVDNGKKARSGGSVLSATVTTTTTHSWKLVNFDIDAVYLETCECLMLMLCIWNMWE